MTIRIGWMMARMSNESRSGDSIQEVIALITIGEVEALIRRQMRGKQSKDIVLDENTELRDMGLSSLQIAEVVFSLEEEHEVEFDPARSADAKTLGDLIRVGNEAIAGRGAVTEGQAGGWA